MFRKRLGNAIYENNEGHRNRWIKKEIKALPSGTKLLDAGAGECKWKKECGHLTYVSQDFCQYGGERGWKRAANWHLGYQTD